MIKTGDTVTFKGFVQSSMDIGQQLTVGKTYIADYVVNWDHAGCQSIFLTDDTGEDVEVEADCFAEYTD